MNRLQSRAPGGPIVLSGTVNEAATVTIDGQPATVDGSNNFNGTTQIGPGTTTVTLKAKDYSGNETTKQYEIDAGGSTTGYTYDANGNLTSDGTKTYYWNALNQLVEVQEGTTTIASFEYDGAGRRTERVAAGLTHQYIYDAEDVVEERITGSSSDTIRHYHGAGIDEPLARKNSSDVVTYYLADHLGSVVQESSAGGGITLEREYDAWGVAIQGASTSGYAFTGREWDAETQLHYYRARYYSPEQGRFMSDDPSGLSAGVNLLDYVGNSPAGRIDPLGLKWFRPPNENPVFGREGSPIDPNGLGRVIADNVPAAHSFSKIHDKTLDEIKASLPLNHGFASPRGVIALTPRQADYMFNFPTMPEAAIQAIVNESKTSFRNARDFLKKTARDASRLFTQGNESKSCPK